MPLDRKNKDDLPTLNYFEGKKVLIVHPSSSIRMTIRKVMTGIGVKNNDIVQTDSTHEGMTLLVENRPNFLFVLLGEDDHYVKMIEKATEYCPNRLKGGTYLLTSDNSKSISSLMYEYELDCIIAQPYTNKSLEGAVLNSVADKINPTPAFKILCDGKEQLNLKNENKAFEIFSQAVSIGKGVSTAFYYLAKIEILKGNNQNAIDYIQDGLKDNAKNYYCLSLGITLQFEQRKYHLAYEYAKRLVENFPLSPNRIPELIRLSIMTQNYEDIANFGTMVKSVPNVGNTVKRYVAAGLATCGRYLVMKNQFDKAEPILKNALSYCDGKMMIIENIVWSYCMAGQLISGRTLFRKLCGAYNIDKKIQYEYELRMLSDFSKSKDEIIGFADKVIRERVYSFAIFKLVLESLKGIDRRKELLEDIVFLAIKHYPDSKEEFQKYL